MPFTAVAGGVLLYIITNRKPGTIDTGSEKDLPLPPNPE